MTGHEALVLGDALNVGDADFRAAIEALGGLTGPFDRHDVETAADRLEVLRQAVSYLRARRDEVA